MSDLASAPLSLAVLISSRGSNLGALIDAIAAGRLRASIRLVISSRPQAAGLALATAAGIPTAAIDHRPYGPDAAGRAGFEQALADALDAATPQLIVLAGFMRVLTPAFTRRYAGRLLNIHPALLPEFPGLDTHARALAAGVAEHGVSVHFVTEQVDGGPVIAQIGVPVQPDDDAHSLAARVLRQEHRLYPEVIRWYAEGRLRWRDGRALLDGRALDAPVRLPAV